MGSRFLRGLGILLPGVLLLGLVRPLWAQKDTSTVEVVPFSIDSSQPLTSAEVVDVAVRLPPDGVRAGTTFEVFVMVQVADGWHVNAHTPARTYLIGTSLEVEPHADLRVLAAYYPDPLFRAFAFAADTLTVYEGEIAIILAVEADEALSPGEHRLQGWLRIQACSDTVCLRPSKIDVPIPIPIRS